MLTVFYMNHIPAPYTPHDNYTFVVRGGKAAQIEGYTQQPDRLVKNGDGTYWLISSAPEEMTARNFEQRGQVVLLAKDGKALVLNERLNAVHIGVIAEKEGTLLLKVITDSVNPNAPWALYRADTGGRTEKVTEPLSGAPYVDADNDLYIIAPDKNEIVNVSRGKSRMWWDYDLLNASGG